MSDALNDASPVITAPIDPTNIEIIRALGRIEANQENTFQLLALQKERLDAHGDRIYKLEKGQWTRQGAGAVVGAIFGAVTSWVARGLSVN